MKKFISAFSTFASLLSKLSGIVILLLCITVCVHVILRGFFNSGVSGVYEIVQYGMLTVVAFTLAENELTGGSIVVSVLLDKMRPRIANIFGITMYVLTALGMAYVLYNQILMVGQKYNNGAVTGVLLLPHWILVIIICIGFFFFIVSFLIKIYNMIEKHKTLQNEKLTIDQLAADAVIKSEF
ncbi:MAG: TRAP transporter small permease [Oscillospiraceae bacterium]|nr:TRAP transporter small permease [Oscillospiraceae bacterium]